MGVNAICLLMLTGGKGAGWRGSLRLPPYAVASVAILYDSFLFLDYESLSFAYYYFTLTPQSRPYLSACSKESNESIIFSCGSVDYYIQNRSSICILHKVGYILRSYNNRW